MPEPDFFKQKFCPTMKPWLEEQIADMMLYLGTNTFTLDDYINQLPGA